MMKKPATIPLGQQMRIGSMLDEDSFVKKTISNNVVILPADATLSNNMPSKGSNIKKKEQASNLQKNEKNNNHQIMGIKEFYKQLQQFNHNVREDVKAKRNMKPQIDLSLVDEPSLSLAPEENSFIIAKGTITTYEYQLYFEIHAILEISYLIEFSLLSYNNETENNTQSSTNNNKNNNPIDFINHFPSIMTTNNNNNELHNNSIVTAATASPKYTLFVSQSAITLELNRIFGIIKTKKLYFTKLLYYLIICTEIEVKKQQPIFPSQQPPFPFQSMPPSMMTHLNNPQYEITLKTSFHYQSFHELSSGLLQKLYFLYQKRIISFILIHLINKYYRNKQLKKVQQIKLSQKKAAQRASEKISEFLIVKQQRLQSLESIYPGMMEKELQKDLLFNKFGRKRLTAIQQQEEDDEEANIENDNLNQDNDKDEGDVKDTDHSKNRESSSAPPLPPSKLLKSRNNTNTTNNTRSNTMKSNRTTASTTAGSNNRKGRLPSIFEKTRKANQERASTNHNNTGNRSRHGSLMSHNGLLDS